MYERIMMWHSFIILKCDTRCSHRETIVGHRKGSTKEKRGLEVPTWPLHEEAQRAIKLHLVDWKSVSAANRDNAGLSIGIEDWPLSHQALMLYLD